MNYSETKDLLIFCQRDRVSVTTKDLDEQKTWVNTQKTGRMPIKKGPFGPSLIYFTLEKAGQ